MYFLNDGGTGHPNKKTKERPNNNDNHLFQFKIYTRAVLSAFLNGLTAPLTNCGSIQSEMDNVSGNHLYIQ